MNKRGGFGNYIFIMIMIMVIVILAMNQNQMDISDIDKTIEALNWTSVGNNFTKSLQIATDGSPNQITKSILTITNKAVDFYGYTVFEVAKLAMQTARDNPDIINYKLLLFLVFFALIAPLIVPVFTVIVIIVLIIKEAIQNRREKKELEKIKNAK